VGSADGPLQTQAGLDVSSLERYVGRASVRAVRHEVRERVLRAPRWTLSEGGVTCPRFQEPFLEVAGPAQRLRVAQALEEVLHPSAPAPAEEGVR